MQVAAKFFPLPVVQLEQGSDLYDMFKLKIGQGTIDPLLELLHFLLEH